MTRLTISAFPIFFDIHIVLIFFIVSPVINNGIWKFRRHRYSEDSDNRQGGLCGYRFGLYLPEF